MTKIHAASATLLLCVLFALAAPPVPIYAWHFDGESIKDRSVSRAAGGLTGSLKKSAGMPGLGLKLDGTSSLDIAGVTADKLTNKTITAEAQVSIDAGTKWGSIVGYYQDNGSYEKGWLLGYIDSNFVFSLSTDSKLHTIVSTTAFKKGKWFHLAATYDGKTMALYIDGKPEATGTAARWPTRRRPFIPPVPIMTRTNSSV